MFGGRLESPHRRRLPVPPRAVATPPIVSHPFARDIGQLDRAVNDLRRRAPDLSAATPLPGWQRVALLLAPGGLSAGCVLLEGPGLAIWAVVLALPFAMIALIRIMAVWHVLRRPLTRFKSETPDRRFDDRLPAFSVLVPLYRERIVVPALVAAMARLDYPFDRLEILFVTEADDQVTRKTLLAAGLLPNMRVVTVPPGKPKTKPRALNYALQAARGTLVAVFDAEDIPEPFQLRRAAEAFVEGGPRLACVQARLVIRNADESFLSRQFALEYSALFGGLLPALDHLKLPLPLGGTSNHFRRDLLLKCGGWDPFNVTEDADIGIRLSRLGYEVSVIDAETTEEAPTTWRVWVGQRTRWIKGYIQTYLVHMRRPLRLWRDLGAWKFLGFQMTIGGMILSMLVHPWFYLLLLIHGALGWRLVPQGDLLWSLCSFTLAVGYGAAMLLTTMTALSSGLLRRLLSVIWLPIYWLATSYAAYRAVVDFIVRPFYWEKTPHGTGLHKLLQPHGRRAGESFAAMPLPDLERARALGVTSQKEASHEAVDNRRNRRWPFRRAGIGAKSGVPDPR